MVVRVKKRKIMVGKDIQEINRAKISSLRGRIMDLEEKRLKSSSLPKRKSIEKEIKLKKREVSGLRIGMIEDRKKKEKKKRVFSSGIKPRAKFGQSIFIR